MYRNFFSILYSYFWSRVKYKLKTSKKKFQNMGKRQEWKGILIIVLKYKINDKKE